MSIRKRRGASLFEALLAVVLGGLLLSGALATLASVARGTDGVTRRSDRLQLLRLAEVVVAADGPGRVAGPDGSGSVLPVRAFRGTAWPCPGPPDRVVLSGLRRPDPEKDSVLLLDRSGRWRVAKLSTAEDAADDPAGCPETGRVQRWAVEPRLSGGWVVGRYFERGSYHLADGALRYRRGRSGRQPLTPELLDGASRFARAGAGWTAELVFTRPGRPGEPADSGLPRWTLPVPGS